MEPLKLIRVTNSGELVKSWQFFLIGQELYHGEASGVFDEETLAASKAFQKKVNLQPDGVVGNKTFGAAMQLGFDGTIDDRDDKSGPNFPPRPAFSPLTTNDQRQHLFGTFTFVSAPVPGNPENIRVTNNWATENIVAVAAIKYNFIKQRQTS